MSNILEINDLSVHFATTGALKPAVDKISFQVRKGETLGIVGESGSGKSSTALAIMRLLPPEARLSGSVLFEHQTDLLSLPEAALRRFRGGRIGLVFQEPMTALNPVFSCGKQVAEAIQLHQHLPFGAAKNRTLELFHQVKLPDPLRIFNAYPHELSGGQKQRVLIAMAMSCQPAVLIADEPTTALDTITQRAILDLLAELKSEHQLSMLFISHDLGLIGDISDRVIVMQEGKIVESGAVRQVLQQPEHPYTKGLISCRPSGHQQVHRLPTIPDFLNNPAFEPRVLTPPETENRRTALYRLAPLLEVKNLTVQYPGKKNWLGQPLDWIDALDQLSFEIYPGETFGVVGESGCGKTTLGKTIAGLLKPASGSIALRGERSVHSGPPIAMVFQDPYASLQPRKCVGDAIAEPMIVHKTQPNARACREKAVELLQTVGLQADHYPRFPHELSGGQRQRVCIARALAVQPLLLVCDEITSAIDVSVQATVLNLLLDLREQFGLSYLFISHDLYVVRQMSDRQMRMEHGKIAQIGFPETFTTDW